MRLLQRQKERKRERHNFKKYVLGETEARHVEERNSGKENLFLTTKTYFLSPINFHLGLTSRVQYE